jgi:hypothetical protein
MEHRCKLQELSTLVKYRVIKKSLFTWWLQYKNPVYSNNPHTIDDLKMAITECVRNVDRAILNSADRAILNSADRAILDSADRAILNTVFEDTVRRVNKCLGTGGGHFEHYL